MVTLTDLRRLVLVRLLDQDLLIGAVMMRMAPGKHQRERDDQEQKRREQRALVQWLAPMSSCSVIRGMPARWPAM